MQSVHNKVGDLEAIAQEICYYYTAGEVEERVEFVADTKEDELSFAGDSEDVSVGTKTDGELIERKYYQVFIQCILSTNYA